MDDIIESIKKKLFDIEREENVRIIYACESGSRAWGFASPDSDYDVRFVYVRPMEEYLKLEETRDVIESELNDVYDINGWDISKFLKLLTKSNPVIFEWADSPIVYKTSKEWDEIKTVLDQYFIPCKGMYHYVSMAKNNVRAYFQGPEVKLKKYLYILRPVLACVWIREKHCPPPTEFKKLVEEVLPDNLTLCVEKLLAAKMKASEKDTGSRIPELDAYIEQKIGETLSYLDKCDIKAETDWDVLDKVFIQIIKGIHRG